MSNTAVANEETKYLDLINDKLSAIAFDPSSVANGWQTLAINNITITGSTAPSAAVITGTSVFVKMASTTTVLFDVTGATSGIVLEIAGGISGFGFVTLRSVTASAGFQGFRIGNATTGGALDTTGVSRIDDLRLQVSLAANTGAGTGAAAITVRTRFLTQRS